MTALVDFFVSNPEISAALVALAVSLINGLAGYSYEARGIAGLLDKLLDAVSFLQRSDSPGTVKVPLTKSRRPEEW